MELIKITEQNGQQAVSARDLHVFLESKQNFSHWIKDRIDKYGLIESQDFEVLDKIIQNPNGGRPTIEYALTLDTAKELAMVEGNDKGRQARRYFIACENKLKELPLQPMQGIVTSNADHLLDMMADVCLIENNEVRVRLTNKVLAMKDTSYTRIQPSNDNTLYTNDCKQIVSAAITSDYTRFLRSFMNNRDLAVAASVIDLAERYVANHTVSFKRSAFFTELGREIEISNIKHLPRTYRPLKDKIRDYSKGTNVVNLIYAKNTGNQNAKRS